MTEREIERAYRQSVNEEKPDLWARIEAGLPEETKAEASKEEDKIREVKPKRGIRKIFGSTLATAACICGIFVLGTGFASVSSNMRGMGSYSASSSAYTAGSGYEASGSVFSSSRNSGMAYEYGYMEDGDMVMEAAGEAAVSQDTTDADVLQDTSRKLIRNINMTLETKTFDDMIALIQAQASQAGGYIESSDIYGNTSYSSSRRSASFTIRIPSGATDAFLESLSSEGAVTYTSESVEDVSLTYLDTESRIQSLRTEQERLLALLESAETVEDIMAIETRLTDVRYQLESYESQLRNLDNRINYDTVYLSVNEVKEATLTEEASFAERIARGFSESLEGVAEGISDFILMVIINIPYYVVFFIILVVVIKLVKVIIRRVRKK